MFFSFSASFKNSSSREKVRKLSSFWDWQAESLFVSIIIIKIIIFSLVIGFKMSYFSLIRLPSCYWTVCYWIVCYWTVCYRTVLITEANHIQRCSLNEPITFKVLITCACARACFCFCVYASFVSILLQIFSFFRNLIIFLFHGNCNFYD